MNQPKEGWEDTFRKEFPTLGTVIIDVGGDTDEIDQNERVIDFIRDVVRETEQRVAREMIGELEAIVRGLQKSGGMVAALAQPIESRIRELKSHYNITE